MNEEDIFVSFPGNGSVIASDVVRAVSYIHSGDIVQRDMKPAIVLMSNSHLKRLQTRRTGNGVWQITYCL